MVIEKELVRDLLDIRAVQINAKNYFTWTSGVKSPIYCDNRLIMSYPAIRKKVTEGFISLLEANNWKPDVIAGCATAGIPHAAWLSTALDLPLVYVRSKPKAHGKGNQIEGIIESGQRVVVIEDLISTGGSAIQSAKALTATGADVAGVLAIFSYGLEKAKDNFRAANLIHETVTNFDELLEALTVSGELSKEEMHELLNWRNTLN
ncbi:orotate phosphoribosyltransferase [Oceanobacillus alkalisoli]|uniref:orotate phosphoribosyltransferase n=1 Tax=Oceanobacillus alkalisoli TaxID=2925113 RepID=UPI001EF0F158|nr:orotate phosphoribosyltransferase [Oceanobacillus alkalisoli]MCF3942494.1 orotate phosphoribosyltransferase [Oceanobacillus alkalisoli]MCG5103551.1 orotate phosphoribosyltransferase [Oceanobacillus alkalisoli]